MSTRTVPKSYERNGLGRHGPQPPTVGHTLQFGDSTVSELDSRASDEIPHGLRHEHLARRGPRRDARADVDRDATDLTFHELAFAGVDSGPYLETETTDGGGR